MTLYHVNPASGSAGACNASQRPCPFGEDNHYTSLEAAESAIAKTEKIKPALNKSSWRESAAEVKSKWSDLLSPEGLEILESVKAWRRSETKVIDLLAQACRANENGSMKEKSEIMTKISGLHFAKESLSNNELVFLESLEAMQITWLNELREARKKK